MENKENLCSPVDEEGVDKDGDEVEGKEAPKTDAKGYRKKFDHIFLNLESSYWLDYLSIYL